MTVWRMDPPPGPEVAVVYDAFGVLWRRDVGDPNLWLGNIGHGYADHRSWPELLARGPVTDAEASG